jgi:hypothetical protein
MKLRKNFIRKEKKLLAHFLGMLLGDGEFLFIKQKEKEVGIMKYILFKNIKKQ